MKIVIIRSMKSVAALVILPMMAFGVTVGPLPQSDYADTEASTNLPFQVDFATMSRIEFTLSLVASPSNVVEVAIGTDANADGILSLDETDQTFGYNCGNWFQRDSIRETEVVAVSGQTLNGHNSCVGKTFILKKRMMDPAWNLIRVVRRGVSEIGEIVLVSGKKPGAVLFVR